MVEITIKLGCLRQIDPSAVRTYFYDCPDVAARLKGISR